MNHQKYLIKTRRHLVVNGILQELWAAHVGGHLGQPLEPLEVLPDVGEAAETVRHQQQVLINQLVHHKVNKGQAFPRVPAKMIPDCVCQPANSWQLP